MIEPLRTALENHNFVPLRKYMQWCNEHYYSKQPAIGAMGDFITAPEISQMFGEMIGIWIISRWHQMGEPERWQLIELGPGKATLMSDILRVLKAQPKLFRGLELHFNEVSPLLRAMQENILSKFGVKAFWHDDLNLLAPAPFIVIANEFFDALPIQQLVYSMSGWLERGVMLAGDKLEYTTREISDPYLLENVNPSRVPVPPVPGNMIEDCPMLGNYLRWMLCMQNYPGSALIIDYAYTQHTYGDTFQAVHHHQFADPLERPGWQDLTAHVNYAVISDFARKHQLQCAGPIGQGDFLRRMGIEQRAQNLMNGPSEPLEKIGIMEAMHRLTDADEMGTLFKAICLSSPQLPMPEGFYAP